jgi:hypothetical protein
MNDAGGWLWLIIDVGLVAALGFGIAYGVLAWRRRRTSPEMERVRDEATRRAYEPNEANKP